MSQQYSFLLLKADQAIAAAAYPATANKEKCQVLLQYNPLREPTSYLVAKSLTDAVQAGKSNNSS